MLYIRKLGDDYLKILTDDKMKDFVVIIFGKYLKSAVEKTYPKGGEVQTLIRSNNKR